MKTQLLTFKLLLSATIIVVLLSCNSCSKDEPIDKDEEFIENPDTSSINTFILNLNYNQDELLGVEETGGEALLKTKGETKSDDSYSEGIETDCKSVDYNLKVNFEDVAILRPTNGIVYPGALVIGNQTMRDGLPEPFQVSRAPITLRLDLPGIGDQGNIDVEDVSNSQVQSSIDNALEWWNANKYVDGYVNPSNSSYSTSASYSSKQMSLEVGMNAEWATGDVSAQFNYETSTTKRVAVMVYKQVFYTVTMDLPLQPADVFGTDVPLTTIETTFNSNTPPAYVHSVNYGRIIMFRMETTEEATEAELKGAFNYASGLNSASGDVEAKYKDILNESNITTVTIGGNAEVASQAVTAKDFGDLQPIITGENAVYSRNNPGVPIAYTIRYLKDNSLAKMGYSTDYVALNCTSEGRKHNQIRFKNEIVDNFRIGVEFKSKKEGGDIIYSKIDWKYNKVSGESTYIKPDDGAYDIFYHVERAKAGTGYESKLRDDIGGYVNDYEDCFVSYADWKIGYYEAKVKSCD